MTDTDTATARAETRHPEVIAQHERLDRLRDEIFELGLERNVVELELYGYTVISDVKPMSFFDELRETILKLGEEDQELGRIVVHPEGGPAHVAEGDLAYVDLRRDPKAQHGPTAPGEVPQEGVTPLPGDLVH